MNTGKFLRMQRVIEPDSGTSVICALDHGMTSPTYLGELSAIADRATETVRGGANVIMMSAGMIDAAKHAFTPTTSFAMLLSASAIMPGELNHVVEIGKVETALQLGADAVVVYVALGGASEDSMISFVARTGEACRRLGMPFIAEAEFPTTYRPDQEMADQFGEEYLRRNVRLCAELGADIIKTNWPGDRESFIRVLAAAGDIPVVLAGGSRVEDLELLTRMQQSREAGAIGCSVGRNIFQHRDPEAITRALCRVIREGWSAESAHEELVGAVENKEAF